MEILSTSNIRKENEIKGKEISKEEIKLYLLAVSYISCRKFPENYKKPFWNCKCIKQVHKIQNQYAKKIFIY